MTRPRLVSLGAVLVALALALLAGLLANAAAATTDARADALAAAKTRVPALLSYDQTTLDKDIDRALNQTTGSFTGEYRRILTKVVSPTAKRRGISTEASVSAAGVVSGDRDKVVVLLFLTQATTTKGDRTSVSGSRVEATLQRTRDGWKVAGLRLV